MKAWHFVGEKLRDGRPVPRDGEWLEHEGELEMCKSGLHASVHPFDALQYAPGNVLCLVEVDGVMINGYDKLVTGRRKILQRMDATSLLRGFARMQALKVVHLWNCPDITLRYLKTGDEKIRDAAGAATWDARDAAGDAARAAWAAWVAAWAAADAAWAAADAAWAAARAAADAADAADAARDEFAFLVHTAFTVATWAK